MQVNKEVFALIRGYLWTIRKRGMNVINAITAVLTAGLHFLKLLEPSE